MALTMDAPRDLSSVPLICRRDDAIDVSDEEYEEYLAAGADETKLKFAEGKEPTRFLLDLDLKGKDAAKIKNSMIGGRDDEGKPKMALGDWQFAVVKRVLKGIQNPASVPLEKAIQFKKDAQGLAADDLVARLDRFGVVNNVFSLYSTLILNDGARVEAKN